MSISWLRLQLRKKNITSPCIHLSHLEIVEIIGPNTREIIWSASNSLTSYLMTTLWIKTFQALLKGIFSWVCFLPFAGKHRSRTVRNPFYIYRHHFKVQCKGNRKINKKVTFVVCRFHISPFQFETFHCYCMLDIERSNHLCQLASDGDKKYKNI